MKKILILGVNGFIGHHLSKRILETTSWEVYGMDMQNDRIGDLLNHPRMHFFEGRMGGVSRSQMRRHPTARCHRYASNLCTTATACI
ncbi:MAG: hypothetical protein RL614_57 [Pseudomonadota bacterium]